MVTSADAMGWAYGKGLSGREPSAITIGGRVVRLSSFYHFLIRMGVLTANPCDALERPKVQPSPAVEVQKILAVIPDTHVPARHQ